MLGEVSEPSGESFHWWFGGALQNGSRGADVLTGDVRVKLILGAIVLAIAIGYVVGGSLRNLPQVRIRWPALALVGLGLQLIPTGSGAGTSGFVLLMVSFALLLVFGIANIRSAGFPLIVLGLVLNALVIGVNHGMPVQRHALMASGQANTLVALQRDGGAKHHLATAHDRLLFLGDVTPIPQPIGQVISAGDVATYLGVMWFVLAAMRPGREDARAHAAGQPAGADLSEHQAD